MKIATALAALVLAFSLSASAEWKTDFEAAKALAKKESKPLLLDFTGSDWCGWCIKMKKESLDQKAFKEFADKNLILVEVDFPERKAQSPALKRANDALQKKYNVEGFPTFLLLDADGKELGRQGGYVKGGPAAFIAKIEEWRKSPAK